MIRIAIVEDDQNYAQMLEKYIARYGQETKQKFSVVTFADGEDIVTNYKADYDIIFMDIEMQFMDGMTSAEEIRRVDTEVVIIFITNMPQYAMKGYAVEALDYVLKPINYFAFSQRLDRALSRLKVRSRRFLSINYKGGIMKLELSSIRYIEVQDHDLLYHTIDGTYRVRGTMKEIEQELAGECFFRCNKCYLVNLEHVNGCEKNYALVGTEKVQVSRARKKDMLDALNDYINEVSK